MLLLTSTVVSLIRWIVVPGKAGTVCSITRTLHIVDTVESSWVQFISTITFTVMVWNVIHTDVTTIPIINQALINI